MLLHGIVIQFTVLDLARIVLILGVILFLLRKGLRIGHVMLISSGALVIFYGKDAAGMALAAKRLQQAALP